MITPVQVNGVFETPLNPIALAISLDTPFVARVFAGDIDKTREIIKKGILHKGFSIIDIYQPCVTFNKLNTFKWFKDHTYYIENEYDPHNRADAFKRALEEFRYLLEYFILTIKSCHLKKIYLFIKKIRHHCLKGKIKSTKSIGLLSKGLCEGHDIRSR